jgi:hypothetical protein
MADAPEKIWAWRHPGQETVGGWMRAPVAHADAEYIRSDIAERQIAELREKLAKAEEAWAKAASNGIADFKRAEAAEAENARLSEALAEIQAIAMLAEGSVTLSAIGRIARAALSGSGAQPALPLKDEVERVLREAECTSSDGTMTIAPTRNVVEALSRLRAGEQGGWRHGPYGYLIKPIGLNEEHWHLAIEPSPYPDEEVSVPLYADQDQLPAAPSEQGGDRG